MHYFLFFEGWRFSFGIAVGGAIGAGNLSALAWSINSLLGTEKAQAKMVLLSVFKLLVIFSVVLSLAALRLINAWGLLAGFTAVMALIVKAGLVEAKKGG